MVNVYEKSGFQNPSIPKPAGGYSSTVKPASAPMRQGGLSQLAAKAAMQGRQPSVGNPPIPDTSRGVFQPRASEAPPPQGRSQELPGGYRPSLTPQVTPQRGGMIGALGQQRIAPQGQSRGMLAAAAEAPPRTPYTAPFVQIPGAGIDYAQGLADFYARGAAKPGGDGYAERGEAHEARWKERYPESYEKVFGGGGGDGDEGLIDPAGGFFRPDPDSEEKASLIAGGMRPQMADLYMELKNAKHGLSDEELAKQISKGAGIQAEMMAGIGLGASGLAGTGFGDIYSQVLSDNEQLALQEKMGTQNLMAQLLSGEAQRKELGKEDKSAMLLGWATEMDDEITAIDPRTSANYDKWKALGKSDGEIQAEGRIVGGKYYLPPPPKEGGVLPDNLFDLEGMPPDDYTDWAIMVAEKYGVSIEDVELWLSKNGYVSSDVIAREIAGKLGG